MLAGPRRRLSACCGGCCGLSQRRACCLGTGCPGRGRGRRRGRGPALRSALRAPGPNPMAGSTYMINDCLQGSISNGPDTPKAGDVERRWVYSYYP